VKRKNIVIVTPALAGTDRGSEKPHGLDGMTASCWRRLKFDPLVRIVPTEN